MRDWTTDINGSQNQVVTGV